MSLIKRMVQYLQDSCINSKEQTNFQGSNEHFWLHKMLLFLKNDNFLLFCRDGLKLETELLDGKTKLILSPYGMLCY